MSKTIIVTGGAGFIGSNFVFHMLDKYPEYRIVCLDKLTYAGNLSTLEPVMKNPNFRFVKADICDRDAVYRLFEEEKPDIIVNFAAESHVDRSIENPDIFLKRQILWVRQCLWMPAENMELRDIIRYPPMKCMEICRLTDLICSLQKKHRFIQALLTAAQRQQQIFWYWHTTELTDCLSAYPDVRITMDRIISRRN